MPVTQVTGASWKREHDLSGSPLFPSVKIWADEQNDGEDIRLCRQHFPLQM
jgi:hypothetical protein